MGVKVVVVCVLLTLAGAGAAAQDDVDPPPQGGRLSALNGEVSYQHAGGHEWMNARRNIPVAQAAGIYTDEKGRAEIQIGQSLSAGGSEFGCHIAKRDSDGFDVCAGAGVGAPAHARAMGRPGGLFEHCRAGA